MSSCAGRFSQGLDPACVATCMSRAIVFRNLDDPDSEAPRSWSRGGMLSLTGRCSHRISAKSLNPLSTTLRLLNHDLRMQTP